MDKEVDWVTCCPARGHDDGEQVRACGLNPGVSVADGARLPGDAGQDGRVSVVFGPVEIHLQRGALGQRAVMQALDQMQAHVDAGRDTG